jgi:hypothetical protein
MRQVESEMMGRGNMLICCMDWIALVMFVDMFDRLYSLVWRQARGQTAAVEKKRA